MSLEEKQPTNVFTLKEHVNSSNITGLSLSAAFNEKSRDQIAPTTDELYRKITRDFDYRINFAETIKERDHFINNKEKFVDLMKAELPDGFEIVPVLFSKVKRDAQGVVRKEYCGEVHKRFLRFLGENHKEELLKLGFDECFIKSLKTGILPRSENKLIYALSIDHIIERSEGGLFSIEKDEDTHNISKGSHSYLVNHFNNLVLMPQKIHNLKNALNAAQCALHYNTPNARNGIWYLMLAPKANTSTSGFVCVPQNNNEKYGILPSGKKAKPADKSIKMETIEEKLRNQQILREKQGISRAEFFFNKQKKKEDRNKNRQKHRNAYKAKK